MLEPPATFAVECNWSDSEIWDALEWYAQARRMTVFTRVPVTGPDVDGWGPNCPELLEIIALPASGGRGGMVCPFEPRFFEEAIATGAPIRPILAVNNADRPSFGYLATRQAFVARAWHPNGPIQPLTLVDPGNARQNVSPAYFSAGFDIVPVDGEIPPLKSGGSSGWHKYQDPWEHPTSGEDWTLNALWKSRNKRGWWAAEFAVGTGAPRRIDALVVATTRPEHSPAGSHVDSLRAALESGLEAELIEAKKELDVPVVGQILCGAQMLTELLPGHGRLTLTVAVPKGTATDEPLLWFCHRFGIRVEEVAVPE